MSLFRDLHAAELFDGHRIAEVHIHPGQVIHAVGVGDELYWRDVFTNLFGAAVQITKVRNRLRNDLAVGAQYQAEHAVRAGMLRSHVDEHLVGTNVKLYDGWVLNSCHIGLSLMINVLECRDIQAGIRNPFAADDRSSPRKEESGAGQGVQ